MSAWAAFRSAWRALAANALRSVLTMLGIIIGVGAVIAMVAVGQGATDRVQEQMQALGSNIMLVVPGGVSQAGVRLGAQTRQRLTEEDALAIGLEIPEVQVAAPTSRATVAPSHTTLAEPANSAVSNTRPLRSGQSRASR